MLITKYVVQLAMWTNDKDRYEYDLFHSYSWKKTNNFFQTYLKKLISIGIDTKSIKSTSMCNIGTVIKCKNGSKIRLLITFVPEAEATVEEAQHLRKATFAVVDVDIRDGKIYIFNDKDTAESFINDSDNVESLRLCPITIKNQMSKINSSSIETDILPGFWYYYSEEKQVVFSTEQISMVDFVQNHISQVQYMY